MCMNMDEIKSYLEENGIKHVWLAERLNISESYLSLILSEAREMPEWWESRVREVLKWEQKGELDE